MAFRNVARLLVSRKPAQVGSNLSSAAVGGKRFASKFTLPELPYAYNALEPHISGQIMEIHHSKHHQAYVTGLNKALESLEEKEGTKDVGGQIALQPALRFNGGGHINHSIFWKNLAPVSEGGGEPPQGALASAIERDFHSLDAFIKKASAAGAGVQGSGWVWLGATESGHLVIETTANQDPLVTKGLTPLLGIDVWEHAYYLQYKNVRPDYLSNIWKVVNWKDVADRYKF
eukprot:TRINITY_DN29360_c0_g1_i1.p1 TRINITY_DN29360_c0_g1~~TRINITY_DN29360_c0_g1_i1.p1  ORF type:complete len:231 (-),score=35.02 TRINITY_DN29360_c0_g1_i1:319-1011(-)